MSLYSDLNEVLTPYAQKIKGLDGQVSEINESLDDVKADLSGVSSDLQSLQNKFDALIDADEGRY